MIPKYKNRKHVTVVWGWRVSGEEQEVRITNWYKNICEANGYFERGDGFTNVYTSQNLSDCIF